MHTDDTAQTPEPAQNPAPAQASRWSIYPVMAVLILVVTLAVIIAYPRPQPAKASGCGPDGCSHDSQTAAPVAVVAPEPPAPAAQPAASTSASTAACPETGATMESLICPVMGSKIASVEKAVGKSVYQGKTYYFCCAGCKPAFDKDPARYVKKA